MTLKYSSPLIIVLSIIAMAGQSHQILLQCRNPFVQSAVNAVVSNNNNNHTTINMATNSNDNWPTCSQDLLTYYQGALDQCLMIDNSNAVVACQQCAGDQLLNSLCQSKLNTTTPCSVCGDPLVLQKSSCYNPRVLTEPPVVGMPACEEFLWTTYGSAFENCAIAHNQEGPGCRECARGYQLNAQCNSLFNLVSDEKRCAVCDALPADKVERMPFSSSADSSTSGASLLRPWTLLFQY
jgi:hypothetical protein